MWNSASVSLNTTCTLPLHHHLYTITTLQYMKNAMQSTRPFSRSPHPYTRTTKTPSDSGTEADDESTGVLKGLPAPPARPRKGLDDGPKKSGDGLEKKKIAEKRAEVLRRLCEVGLVACVGVVVLRPVEVRDVAWVWGSGMLTLV